MTISSDTSIFNDRNTQFVLNQNCLTELASNKKNSSTNPKWKSMQNREISDAFIPENNEPKHCNIFSDTRSRRGVF